MKYFILFFTTFLFLYPVGALENQEESNVNLVVQVEGLRNDRGDVFICLWKETDSGFPSCEKGKNPFRMEIASAKLPQITFQNVPKGFYAISVFHDEEKTQIIKTNFIGMPKSGVGASGKLGMIPSFEKSKIEVTHSNEIKIKMVYL